MEMQIYSSIKEAKIHNVWYSIKIYYVGKETGKYDPWWGGKSINKSQHRIYTDVRDSRWVYENSYCNHILYVQKEKRMSILSRDAEDKKWYDSMK